MPDRIELGAVVGRWIATDYLVVAPEDPGEAQAFFTWSYAVLVTEPDPELMARLPLLEAARTASGLSDVEAAELVAFGATAWSDHWASTALDWVDQGVWDEDVAAALRLCADNETYAQRTRHRAWAYIKPSGQPE